MSKSSTAQRVALSPKEFAALFGKSQTWEYRKIYEGKVKTMTEYGRILIPAVEVERILGEAGIYDGPKVKMPKREGKLDAWRQFINERRHTNTGTTSETNGHSLVRLHPDKATARFTALARFTKRKDAS